MIGSSKGCGMKKRLSDTEGLRKIPVRDLSSCPDSGRAITAASGLKGVPRYGAEEGDRVVRSGSGAVGPEGLRSAVMILNEGRMGK